MPTSWILTDAEAPFSETVDEFILEWMADIYTYLQWKYSMLSSDIIRSIKPEELYEKYHPLHETSIENGVEKLRRIYLNASER